MPSASMWRGAAPPAADRRGDAATVVDDLDQLDAAALDRDADAGRAGVEGVLDELLDDGDRSLDDLSGGDLADGAFVEEAKGQRRLLACIAGAARVRTGAES